MKLVVLRLVGLRLPSVRLVGLRLFGVWLVGVRLVEVRLEGVRLMLMFISLLGRKDSLTEKGFLCSLISLLPLLSKTFLQV